MKLGFNDKWKPGSLKTDESKTQGSSRFDIERNEDVYISDRKLKQILDEYETVVVYDYGDEYHLTEEERLNQNIYYQEFSKLAKCKKKYRKLDQFILVMRQVLKCLDMVAKNNMLYDPDTFKKMWFNKKITITGLFLPIYKGKDKKQLSWEYISEFILSDEDISSLDLCEKEEYKSEEEIREYMKGLYTEDELEEITTIDREKEEKIYDAVLNGYTKNLPDKCIAEPLSKKETKEMFKSNPELVIALKEHTKAMYENSSLQKEFQAYEIGADDIEKINRYDRKRRIENDNGKKTREIPDFKGDIFNTDEYNRYMYELQQYMDSEIYYNYQGKLKTKEQIEEMETKMLMEENGWNIRRLYGNMDLEKKIAKAKKKAKKKEKRIKKRLLENQRKSEEIEERIMGIRSERKKIKKKIKKKQKRRRFLDE